MQRFFILFGEFFDQANMIKKANKLPRNLVTMVYTSIDPVSFSFLTRWACSFTSSLPQKLSAKFPYQLQLNHFTFFLSQYFFTHSPSWVSSFLSRPRRCSFLFPFPLTKEIFSFLLSSQSQILSLWILSEPLASSKAIESRSWNCSIEDVIASNFINVTCRSLETTMFSSIFSPNSQVCHYLGEFIGKLATNSPHWYHKFQVRNFHKFMDWKPRRETMKEKSGKAESPNRNWHL